LKKMLSNPALWRGVVSIAVFLILWEIGARSRQWMAPEFFAPFRELLGAIGLKKDYLPPRWCSRPGSRCSLTGATGRAGT